MKQEPTELEKLVEQHETNRTAYALMEVYKRRTRDPKYDINRAICCAVNQKLAMLWRRGLLP